MSRIFFDTNLFIYLFENHPQFCAPTRELLERMGERNDQLFTSWITAAEVQIKPWQLGLRSLCDQYKELIESCATVLPFDEKASEAYRNLRAFGKVKGPDALQLACAAAAGVELFVTNDARLQGVDAPGIHFIVPLERVPI